MAIALTAVAALPLFAETKSVMEFDGRLVTVHADEFTNEYDFTAIRIGILDRNEGDRRH